MANGFKINKKVMRNLTREIERDFAKNPVRVPLRADHSTVALPAAKTVNNYHGPVVFTVNGDNAQVAWGNQSSTQVQKHADQVAAGYEQLAELLTDILANLPTFQLDGTDGEVLRENANLVLQEVVKSEPDQSVVRRGVTLIKGLLAPLSAGIGKAVTEEAVEAARQAIYALGSSLPF
ncbi:hypothetical protein [Dermabacter vaginalis]|nr:hypothetical protein [Dermabacter vaginalis]